MKPKHCMIVVTGRSEEEHEEQSAAMKASGDVTDSDLIGCIVNFGGEYDASPDLDADCGS